MSLLQPADVSLSGYICDTWVTTPTSRRLSLRPYMRYVGHYSMSCRPLPLGLNVGYVGRYSSSTSCRLGCLSKATGTIPPSIHSPINLRRHLLQHGANAHHTPESYRHNDNSIPLRKKQNVLLSINFKAFRGRQGDEGAVQRQGDR